jgi:hypothetical protein
MKTVAATLYLYDPDFEGNAEAFQAETGADCVIRAVAGFDDLVKALADYTNVGFLVLDTHGAPGKVALADGSRIEGLDFRLLRLLPKDLLRRGARVLFYGCNIGEGAVGDQFLEEFGLAAFRGKGGTAGASTVPNFTFTAGPLSAVESWMSLASPFAARLKVVHFNEAGMRDDSVRIDRWGNRD